MYQCYNLFVLMFIWPQYVGDAISWRSGWASLWHPPQASQSSVVEDSNLLGYYAVTVGKLVGKYVTVY